MSLIEAPITVSNVIRNVDTNTYFIELLLTELNGSRKVIFIPRAHIARPNLVVERLLQEGAQLPASPKDALALVKSLLPQAPAAVRNGTRKTGWAEGTRTFVFPDRSYGQEQITYLGDSNRYETKGTVKSWRRGIREVTGASSFALFATALGFAGCLIKPCKQSEGFVFHLTGKSSGGKSTIELLALSVSGRAERFGFLTHDATDRGIEEAAASANHQLLVIDELGRGETSPALRRKKLSNLAYGLAGGQGRQRSKAVATGLLENVRFQLVGLSSGEVPLEGDESSGRRQQGERVRFIEISIPDRRDGGIFDRLAKKGRKQKAAELAALVEREVCKNFGVPIRRFIQRFLADYNANSQRARQLVDAFVGSIGAKGGERLSRKFGLVYAAAVLAAEFGIAPWSAGNARRSIARVYRNALRVADPKVSARDFLRRIGRTSKSGTRIVDAPKGKVFDPANHRRVIGVKRRIDGEKAIAILTTKYHRLVRPRWHARSVLRRLRKIGVLLDGNTANRNVRQLQVRGLVPNNDRPLFFAIRTKALNQALRKAGG